MKNDNRPIGVFDSGLGGLTVLRSLKETFQNESFIYFGDTARLPYGTKSQETIIRYSKEICDFLNKNDVKLIIVACNTASALAVKFLKSYLKLPIINVIDPCVEFASKVTKNNFIGVIGTQATINSKAYNKKLDRINSSFKIISQECSLFVPLIEEGFIKHQITKDVCHFYLNKKIFQKIDVLIMGCTHYPILIDYIKQYFSDNTIIVDSAKTVAFHVEQLFDNNSVLRASQKTQNIKYYLSDKSIEFNKLAAVFLKTNSLDIDYIKL